MDSMSSINYTCLLTGWIKDLLEERGMGMVVGAPGVGKTQLSLQMGTCMALGKPFLGWGLRGRSRPFGSLLK